MIKVLAVDENSDDLTFLKATISEAFPGSAFIAASNGQTGIEQAHAEDPDVVLLDIATPGMDGVEVCRRLKEDGPLRDIPVIFLTHSKTSREDRVRALEAGAEGFLLKPVDGVELTVQIRTMTKMKAANRFHLLEKERLTALVDERTRELKEEITERKQAEADLRRTHRAHHAISECNQLLVRAIDERALLDGVCRVLVEHGGYRMAWVGIAERDEAKSVRQVAQAGFEEGYLDTVNITWADTECGHGPTGTAIRIGQPVIARNIPTDPAYGPWRAAAIQRGYVSSIALPLICGNQGCNGALMVYAAKPDAFDATEVALLNELAGNLGYGISVLRMRNEHQRAVEELRQSQKRFSDAFQASPAGMSITRISDGRFIEINETFLRMFEFSREEVVGHTSVELNMLAPDERTMLIQRQLESGGLRNHDLQARTRSGQIRHMLFSSNPIELAGQSCHITTLIDVTDRKSAEKSLYESEARLRLSVAASNIGLWDWDLQTNTVYFSPEWKRQIGYRDNELSNDFSEWQSRVHPDDLEQTFQKVHTFLTDPRGHHEVEFRFRHRDGSYRWIYTHADVLRDTDGKPVRMLGCHIDITERKLAEMEILKYRDHLEELVKERTKELAEANRHLQELDRLKSLFIASMSHELRTPLNSIIGFTGIILMGMSGEISAVQRKQLGMVKKSANHLLNLINDVIDVSKIETGKTDISIEAFDLSDLVLEVKESFSVIASEKGLNLEWETEAVTEVTSDRRRVRQILLNLIGNAVKFTETGTVTILLSKTKKGVHITVCDTGVGIEPADMEMLFTAFSRIHIQGRPFVEGTGLGLYLTRRIATLLGGEITAESEPGRGSTFTLFLPWEYPEEKK